MVLLLLLLQPLPLTAAVFSNYVKAIAAFLITVVIKDYQFHYLIAD